MVLLLISEAISLLGRHQYAEAIELLDQATRLAPDDYDAWHLLAVAHRILQQWEHCLEAASQASACSVRGYARSQRYSYAKALSLKASALIMLERYEEALATYDEALTIDAIDPGEHPIFQTGLEILHTTALKGKGVALSKLGRHEEARAAHDSALSIPPSLSVILVNKANALRDLHRYEEALALYDRILAQSPQNAQVWREKATTLRAAGRDDEADAAEQHLNESCG